MCGICGLYNFRTGEPANEQLVHKMAVSIIHRGPDDEGYFVNGSIGLGMRRLSIIDLVSGKQPMSNETGSIWIVFNGEIYNFNDLRQDLEKRGHCFRTKSDTETIIHAYEEWGVEAFEKLNGMFGFALWDSSKQELILARDIFGIKPLYYTQVDGKLLFGSEIKAILADPSIERNIDLASLDDFLTFSFVPSPYTLFSGIRKIPPGHFLQVSSSGLILKRFAPEANGLQTKAENEWLEALRAEIESAVHRQMVADVPVGVMLSGGVDSATVAKLMQRFKGEPIHTFTIGFAGKFDQNELVAARRSAELIGSEHHEAVITAEEYARFLPKSLWYLEEPVATASTLAFYWICKLAREHVKVVLTGQGADEPFAGYGRHLGEYYSGWFRGIPSGIREYLIAPLVESLPRNEQLKRAVRSLGNPNSLERLVQVYTIFDGNLKHRLYKPGLSNGNNRQPREAVKLWQDEVKHLDGLSQMTYVDARFSLADNLLMYGDKMSMAVSLEARVPFLDLELMKLVESMPPQLKIQGRTQKYLLKRAMAAWIAPEIIQRKKIGFLTPVDLWFRQDLKGYIRDRLMAPGSACRSYFEPAAIETLICDHEDHRHDYKRHLFSLLTFELWHDQFISKKH
jgi:asparagine synthase (glutamine-hydrolysing)